MGFFGVEKVLETLQGPAAEIPKYSETTLNNFIPKMEELKKFLPSLASVAKSYSKNMEMELLRKIKAEDYLPTEEELRQVKNDTVLEYIGEILFQREKFESALAAYRKMNSSKVYGILMRK